jgi:phosphinothricin acetyltransferase
VDEPRLRAAAVEDAAALQAIYAQHVLHGLASFETEPPSVDEMRQRIEHIIADGYPYLVAESGGRVVGYAYANHFRTRPAYRFTVEDSVYLARDAVGQGLGRRLLLQLIEDCERLGFRQMVAVIGDSANSASIAVHRACGFVEAGVLRAIGRKFDRWVDSVIMQRTLGPGDCSAPD